jgi:hypothetical protein
LTLYDCAHSLHGQNATGTGVYEHLGAGVSDSVLGFHHPGSFTRSLIRILGQPEAVARGMSVLDLHRKLVNLSKYKWSSSTLDGDGQSTLSDGHAESADRSWLLTKTPQSPVYCHISSCPPRTRGGPTSITLSNLGYPLEAFVYENRGEQVDVEVTLCLKNNDIDIGRWTEWITDAPSEAEQVSLHLIV